jgi:hypothetical protein
VIRSLNQQRLGKDKGKNYSNQYGSHGGTFTRFCRMPMVIETVKGKTTWYRDVLDGNLYQVQAEQNVRFQIVNRSRW